MQTQAESCLLASLSLRAAEGDWQGPGSGVLRCSSAGWGKSRWSDILPVCVSTADVGRDHSPNPGRRRWFSEARAIISPLSIEHRFWKNQWKPYFSALFGRIRRMLGLYPISFHLQLLNYLLAHHIFLFKMSNKIHAGPLIASNTFAHTI